jgi:hypothetical protein
MRVAPVMTSVGALVQPAASWLGLVSFVLLALVVSSEVPTAMDLLMTLVSTSLGCVWQTDATSLFKV